MGVNKEEKFFQQDGARLHIANAVLHFVNGYFHDRAISN
jgi:hypothetical protein